MAYTSYTAGGYQNIPPNNLPINKGQQQYYPSAQSMQTGSSLDPEFAGTLMEAYPGGPFQGPQFQSPGQFNPGGQPFQPTPFQSPGAFQGPQAFQGQSPFQFGQFQSPGGFQDPGAFQSPGAFQGPGAFQYSGGQFKPPDPNDIYKDPAFQARLNAGVKASNNLASSGGMLLSGAQLKDLSRFNQDEASKEYGNIYNRAASEHDRGFGQEFDTQRSNFDQAFTRDQTNYGRAFNENQNQFDRAAQVSNTNYGRQLGEHQMGFDQSLMANDLNYNRGRNEQATNFDQSFAANQANYGRAFGENQNAFSQGLAANQLNFGQQMDTSNTNYGRALGEYQMNYGNQASEYDRNAAAFQNTQANRYNRLMDYQNIGLQAAGMMNGAGQNFGATGSQTLLNTGSQGADAAINGGNINSSRYNTQNPGQPWQDAAGNMSAYQLWLQQQQQQQQLPPTNYSVSGNSWSY